MSQWPEISKKKKIKKKYKEQKEKCEIRYWILEVSLKVFAGV